MATILRVGPSNVTRGAFGKVEMTSPVAVKKRPLLVKDECPVPFISDPNKLRQKNMLSTTKAVTSLFGGRTSVRWSHTDVSFPDFTDYRKDSTKDPTKRAIETEEARKGAHYFTYAIGGMMALYAGKGIVHGIAGYKGAPRSMLALAAVEINLKDIPEGKSSTYLWRGKPVFVRHRTKEQIESEKAVTLSELRHPETDESRVKKPEWLVVIGICTHLGCVPIANSGSFGGYYCPCHGSHYDTSGRIRQGPAPLNLEVPEYYEFTDDGKLIVGKPA